MDKVFLSPGGDDRGAGTVENPVGSLQRALHIARQKNVSVIELSGGTYSITKPVRLGPEDSGLTIQAAPDSQPVLDGGIRVSRWREVQFNGKTAFSANVKQLLHELDRPVHSLFAGGKRRSRSRWPREGCFLLKPNTEEPAKDPFRGTNKPVLADPSVIPDGWDLTGADLRILHKWVDERMPVAAYNSETGTITSPFRSIQRITGEESGWRAERAFLENVREAVTEPGEWFIDQDEGILYIIPFPGETPETMEAVIPAALQLLRLEGRFDETLEPVKDVRIRGLTFRHTDWVQPVGDWGYRFDPYTEKEHWPKRDSFHHFINNNDFDPSFLYAAVPQAAHDVPGVIRLRGAHSCLVENCTVEHIGLYAFELGEGCRDNIFRKNTITDAGAGGFNCDGGNDPSRPALHLLQNVIRDNEINGAGRVFLAACGILICFGSGNQVLGNHIHDLRYTGISCGWTWNRDHQIARENLIAYNHIHDIRGKDVLSDLGGIYILGIQPGTTLRGNHIHDIEFHAYGGNGIYTDAATGNTVVEDNLIYNIKGSGIIVNHKNCENIYRRNVIAFTGDVPVGVMRNPKRWFDEYGDLGRAGTLISNIFCTDGKAVYRFAAHPNEFEMETLAAMMVSEANLIDSSCAGNRLSGKPPKLAAAGWENKPLMPWINWLELGQDRTTLYGEPGFTNPAARDFTLPPESDGAKMLKSAVWHPCTDSETPYPDPPRAERDEKERDYFIGIPDAGAHDQNG
ncbi:MAG: right-handed parallel beta-helix repeat-containing protein [Spirochaetia bacterium]